ncbi:hypothetical protein R5R35_009760 [Gryllus longicercus]|uniref:Uncharacterized protein n=1 Tax=Gryllus longicercus TaxID=2509291 RepID=A0AAN9Z9B2_9ORTH
MPLADRQTFGATLPLRCGLLMRLHTFGVWQGACARSPSTECSGRVAAICQAPNIRCSLYPQLVVFLRLFLTISLRKIACDRAPNASRMEMDCLLLVKRQIFGSQHCNETTQRC